MKNFMQTVNKNIDNNIFLFVISFLIIYNFILYIRVGRFDNIIYFIIIYFALFYYLKNINLSLLITYLLSILLFSGSIMEGFVDTGRIGSIGRDNVEIMAEVNQILSTINTVTDYTSRVSQLQNNITQLYNNYNSQAGATVREFEDKYKDPANFNLTEFNKEKDMILKTLQDRIDEMSRQSTILSRVIEGGGNKLTNMLTDEKNKLELDLGTITSNQSGFSTALSGLDTSITAYQTTYPPKVSGITPSSIFCAAGVPQPGGTTTGGTTTGGTTTGGTTTGGTTTGRTGGPITGGIATTR